MANLEYHYFSQINLADPFFNSLKSDYNEFEEWYFRKVTQEAKAYICNWENQLCGFLYLKEENNAITDISPHLPAKRRLKIGTFKVDAHGTRLGERFIKTILDNAVEYDYDEIYVTVFSRHTGLISLLTQFGFLQYGSKTTHNGTELVLVKNMQQISGNLLQDFPLVFDNNINKYALSIQPQFHSRLFPDSILSNESFNILNDVSHTNSIHKVYICGMSGVIDFHSGDLVLIYRTSDRQAPARFRSVITSLCVVQEIRHINSFASLEDFFEYCSAYSIFTESELRSMYHHKRYPYVIKMTYNAAFSRKVTNGDLIDNHGVNPHYWGVFRLTNAQFYNIIRAGEVNERIVVNQTPIC